MPYDGLVTRKMAEELNCFILNGKVDKIYQVNKDDLVFHIRNTSMRYKLLLSSNANFSRVHLTNMDFDNPKKPFNFCMVLRKYLLGAKLTSIEQVSNDRILKFTFENSNELGDKEIKVLIIEMMGKYSNIILTTPTLNIIDSIKHVDFEISRVREVMPGRTYILPQVQNKIDPLTITPLEFDALVASNTLPIYKFLINTFIGISTPVAKWIENNSQSSIYDAFSLVLSNEFKPCVSFGKEIPTDFYIFPISNLGVKTFSVLSDAIDYFFHYTTKQAILQSGKNNLSSIVSKLLTKSQKKLVIVNEKLDATSNMEDLRIKGELLSANLYKLNSNCAEAFVYNYYTDTSVTINLDFNLSPAENMKKIFKEYNKLKHTYTACSKQKVEIIDEIKYFESLLFEIDSLTLEDDIQQIMLELISEGYLKKDKKNAIDQKKPAKFNLQKFTFEGFDIFVGKNNIQNDYLTFKIASKDDIWLHVKNAPGSHTIIRTLGNEPSISVIEKAASLAAFYSKLKNSSRVEVDYTSVKNVKKIPGAKPGMVIYDNFKTIYIEPVP